MTSLDDSKLPLDKRGKLETDAQIMIKMLPRQIETDRKLSKKLKAIKLVDRRQHREQLHKNVMFDYNELEGRYAKASNDIKVGDEVLCEKAHCTALLQPYAMTHCQHCFTRLAMVM